MAVGRVVGCCYCCSLGRDELLLLIREEEEVLHHNPGAILPKPVVVVRHDSSSLQHPMPREDRSADHPDQTEHRVVVAVHAALDGSGEEAVDLVLLQVIWAPTSVDSGAGEAACQTEP